MTFSDYVIVPLRLQFPCEQKPVLMLVYFNTSMWSASAHIHTIQPIKFKAKIPVLLFIL